MKRGGKETQQGVAERSIQHLRISRQNLTHENKMQIQGLLKETRRYIGPKVNMDTCDCPLIESQCVTLYFSTELLKL